MEQLFTSNMPSFNLKLTTIKVREVPFRKFGVKRYIEYLLPDSTYGEFLILQDGKPKFLFIAFNEKGEITRLARYVNSIKEEYGSFWVKALENQGYRNLSLPRSSILSIRFDKKSTLREFEVYRIYEE